MSHPWVKTLVRASIPSDYSPNASDYESRWPGLSASENRKTVGYPASPSKPIAAAERLVLRTSGRSGHNFLSENWLALKGVTCTLGISDRETWAEAQLNGFSR